MSVEAVRAATRAWLLEKGLVERGERPSEVMRRLADWRADLPRTPRPGPRQWAQDLVARYQAGERLQRMQVTLAHEALGLTCGPVLRVPDPPPPRPDAMERQANDVPEPAF